MKKLLEIDHLYASYGEESVLSDVCMDLCEGQVLCLVGESGSGKSTLIKAIQGREEVVITGGDIRFKGRSLTGLSGKERQKILGDEIGTIPQNPAGSFNPIRRFDRQLREMMRSHGKACDDETIIQTFTSLGLKDPEGIMRSRPYEMSGGMNQRIAISSAMLLKPALLLLDEATSALDVTTAEIVIRELIQLNRRTGTAELMVTHHLGIARQMADLIGIMKDGRLIEFGKAEELLTHPENDYTRKLFRDMPVLMR